MSDFIPFPRHDVTAPSFPLHAASTLAQEPLPAREPVRPWRRLTAALALAGTLLVGAVGGGAAGAAMTRSLSPSEAAPVVVSAAQPAAPALAAGGTIIDIYRTVGPAVVSVTSRGGGQGGTGSGFIIDGQGHILTNNHVVQGATSLNVTLADGRELPARLVGAAPAQDIALIKVDPPAGGLTVARLGDSDAVTPGELAIAIGSPLGLEQTVTAGIVSSIDRTVGGGRRALRGLIQTDAAINPGNSGGPLLNGQGEVIGINTLGSREATGISFAVPINTAKSLLPQLQAGGR